MDFTTENFDSMAAELTRLKVENRLLSQKIEFLLSKLFGKSSEKISPDQLAFEFGVDSVSPGTPEDLPVEEVVIEPEEVLAEPEAFRRIGEEVTEELDVVPTKFFKRRIVRPKYVRKADRLLPSVVAPAPKRIIDNSHALAGLPAGIMLAKYADHLPLYRQSQINKTRHASECLDKILAGFQCIVQSDGYSAYGAYKKRHPEAQIEYAACWAHARRKFHEARNESPFAARILLEIQGLYKIEADLRDNPGLDRRAVRQEKSLPILDRIGLQLQAAPSAHRPKSQTGKAIHYTLNLWNKLLVYTEHAQMEIDNNLVAEAKRR